MCCFYHFHYHGNSILIQLDEDIYKNPSVCVSTDNMTGNVEFLPPPLTLADRSLALFTSLANMLDGAMSPAIKKEVSQMRLLQLLEERMRITWFFI